MEKQINLKETMKLQLLIFCPICKGNLLSKDNQNFICRNCKKVFNLYLKENKKVKVEVQKQKIPSYLG